MYKSIHIQNFRCFEDTKIEGFEQINLIGGQNNAGKTALLEALYFAASPIGKSIFDNEIYNRKKSQTKIDGNDIWKDLFFEFNSEKKINIKINTLIAEETIDIYTDPKIIKHVLLEDIKNNIGKDDLFVSSTNDLIIDYTNSKKEKSQCKLLLKLDKFEFTIDDDDFLNNNDKNLNKPRFLSSNINFNEKHLAEEFDKEKLKGNYNKVLNFCQVIDSQISDIDTFESEIFIKRKDEKFIPLRLWGDALNKVIGYFLQILNGNYKILLIDEIENGIHHTNQQKFWTMLFDLAKEFDIQIFATSHSAEMIDAFQRVGKQKKSECKAMYFELSRNQDTNKIITNKLNMDSLEYEIIKKQPFRGE